MTPTKILVVEDPLVVARDIAEHLTRLHHAVLGIAPTSEEAVRHRSTGIAIPPICSGPHRPTHQGIIQTGTRPVYRFWASKSATAKKPLHQGRGRLEHQGFHIG
jgi:hypothetical protein